MVAMVDSGCLSTVDLAVAGRLSLADTADTVATAHGSGRYWPRLRDSIYWAAESRAVS